MNLQLSDPPGSKFDKPEDLQVYLSKVCDSNQGKTPYGFNPYNKIIFVPNERVKKSFDEFKIRIEKYALFSQTDYLNPFFDFERAPEQ